MVFKVSFVIPAKNEQINLPVLIYGIMRNIPSHWQYDIIVLDHNSTDNTNLVLLKLAQKLPILRIIKIRNANILLGQALQIGIGKALGDFVITLDGDLSHPARFIPEILQSFEKGHDYVLGGRYLKNQPPFRPLSRFYISKTFNLLAKLCCWKPLNDYTTGYRGFQRSLFIPNSYISKDFGFHVEFNLRLARAAKNPLEIPILYIKRKHGTTKLKYHKQFLGYLKGILFGVS